MSEVAAAAAAAPASESNTARIHGVKRANEKISTTVTKRANNNETKS